MATTTTSQPATQIEQSWQSQGFQPVQYQGSTWYYDPKSGEALAWNPPGQRGVVQATMDQRFQMYLQQQQAAAKTAAGAGGAAGTPATAAAAGGYYSPLTSGYYSPSSTGFSSMAAAPSGPSLSTVWQKLTDAQRQQVQQQISSGATTNVNIGGKSYGIYGGPQAVSNYLSWGPAAPGGVPPPAPETTALQQMAQVDPASEALRQQLAQSYGAPLSAAAAAAAQQGAPSAAQLQSYLDLYRNVDPTGLAGRQALEQQITGNLALGSTLDPSTAREVEQATRAAQGARGNVYGTPQMVQEAMTRGSTGLALQQQRQQAAQSYYQAGVDPGTVGLNLWQLGQANQAQRQQLLQQMQQGAQSYLGSGTTPYQAGAGYLAAAQQGGLAASQGGPSFQPAGLGSPYSYLNPQYGQQTSATALGYFQALQNQFAQNYGLGRGGGGMGALGGGLSGALSGAVGGATLGSAIPGLGTLAGAGIGALAGGGLGALGGYSR